MKRIFSFIVTLSVFIASVYGELRYIEIDSIKNVPVIEIKNIDDFEAIINEYGVRIGYLQKTIDSSIKNNKKDMDGLMLYIIVDSVYFSFSMKGYLTLSDFKKGEALKFLNGADYNKALTLGFDNSEIYYYYTKNSFSSIKDCEDAFKNGFVNVNEKNTGSAFSYGNSKNDSAVYYKAREAGYLNYADYIEYLAYTNKGFNTKSDWQLAKTKGFDVGKDYYSALENGFDNFEDYNSAHAMALTSNKDYQKYKQITIEIEKFMKDKNLEKKNAIIYYYIQKLPKGEMALSALPDLLVELFNTQSEELGNALDLWYSDISNINEVKSQQEQYNFNRNPKKQIIHIKELFSQTTIADFLNSVDMTSIGSYSSKNQILKKIK